MAVGWGRVHVLHGRGTVALSRKGSIELASTGKSRKVLEFVNYDLIFVFQLDLAPMEYIERDTHRFATRGRDCRGKHMLINEASASRIGQTRCSRKRYLPGFPAKRVCKDAARQPKANNVIWN